MRFSNQPKLWERNSSPSQRLSLSFDGIKREVSVDLIPESLRVNVRQGNTQFRYKNGFTFAGHVEILNSQTRKHASSPLCGSFGKLSQRSQTYIMHLESR